MVPKDGEDERCKGISAVRAFPNETQNRHVGECFTPNSLGSFITTIAVTAAAGTITTRAAIEEKVKVLVT